MLKSGITRGTQQVKQHLWWQNNFYILDQNPDLRLGVEREDGWKKGEEEDWWDRGKGVTVGQKWVKEHRQIKPGKGEGRLELRNRSRWMIDKQKADRVRQREGRGKVETAR